MKTLLTKLYNENEASGKLKGKTDELKRKISDSLLIFSDITEKPLSYIRDNINYILVYNEKKNSNLPNENQMNPSVNRTQIGNIVTKLANRKFIKFGLGFYEKLFFNEVFTYTKEEFEKEFVEKLVS